jgi:hypothetical protein
MTGLFSIKRKCRIESELNQAVTKHKGRWGILAAKVKMSVMENSLHRIKD